VWGGDTVAVKRETVARETIVPLLLLQFSNGLACGGPRAEAVAAERSARLAGNHRRCAFKLQPPDREIARDIASIDDFPHAQPSPSPIV